MKKESFLRSQFAARVRSGTIFGRRSNLDPNESKFFLLFAEKVCIVVLKLKIRRRRPFSAFSVIYETSATTSKRRRKPNYSVFREKIPKLFPADGSLC